MKDARDGLLGGGNEGILKELTKGPIYAKEKGGMLVVTPVMLANNILRRAFLARVDVTLVKLQKLLWYAYSEFFSRTDFSMLLFSEQFEAYPKGPVSVSVNNAFLHFDKKNITNYARDPQEKVCIADEESLPLLRDVLDFVWDKYGLKSEDDLVNLSHGKGGAWDQVWDETDWEKGNRSIITADHIKRGIENDR